MKHGQVLSFLLVVSFLWTACQADVGQLVQNFQAPRSTAMPCPVRIGIITSTSGKHRAQGEEQLRGYMMARDEINAAGGIQGCWVELVVRDDASDPARAAQMVKEMTDVDRVPVIVGSYSSDATLPAAGAANAYQMPFIVPSASSDLVTTQGYKWVFRVNAPSSAYAKAALDFMAQHLNNPTTSIVFEETLFGESAAVEAARGALKLWFKLLDYEPYQSGSTDYKNFLEWIKLSQSDVLYLASNSVADAVLLMKQCREIDINPKIYIGHAGGYATPDFLARAGSDAEYMLVTTQWTSDVQWPGASQFAERFVNRYGREPDMRAAMSYGAILVAQDAIDRAFKKNMEQKEPLDWSLPDQLGEVRR